MIYLFDKQQNIIGIINESELIAGELGFKINTAITFDFTLPIKKDISDNVKYVSIQHPHDKNKHLLFRLMSRIDNTDSIEFTASELAYQELSSYGYIKDKRPAETDANNLMAIALVGSNWTIGKVNVPGTVKTNFYYVNNLEAIQNVVSLMGGEILFYVTIDSNKITGRYMDYLAQQGSDTSKVFSQGSNLLTVTRTKQTDSIYTAVLPRGKGEQVSEGTEDSPDGYGRRIDISDIEWSKTKGDPLDKPKDSLILADPIANLEWAHVDGNYRLLLQTYDEIEDPNILIQQAYQTLMSVNHPQIQYAATVANVGNLSLGDTVLIMHSERDMSYKTRVFEVKYNIVQPEQTELSLGDDLSSNSITSQINSISSQVSTNSNQVQWTFANGGHHNTSYGSQQPKNPRKGDVWFRSLPNGNTEEYYYDGNIWVLGSTTDQQWKENTAIQQGSNTVFYGTDTPIGAVIGDTWFKNDNDEPDGKAMYTYSGKTWVKFEGGTDASRLQIGTIDAAKINVLNLSADNIVTGNLSANFIKGGQLDFSQINGININVDSLVGNTSEFITSNWDGEYESTSITDTGMTVKSGDVTTFIGNKGMDTKYSKGGFHIGYSENAWESGLIFGLNQGTNFIAFGNEITPNSQNYAPNFLIARNGSTTADKWNIGGGAVFAQNVSFNDNVYWQPGKGIYTTWGNAGRAFFFNTINGGIPAIVSPTGAGIAFGNGGQLYLLAHGTYKDYSSGASGSFTFDHPNITG